ncbi:oligosaccharide flippase family protein [Runella sp. CRIBMP]|uniref:oligosaccharide flippase family protein n=1 Tax=Runella sp. CRIBMP TaxID=2683261 RepID=UPI001412CCE8|nr:oligosaccharide flippase family protein [Runella sp. CRIBMP]NBB20167.1 oligosaccharide flippase family protein [Runella sp. CRIBMP]
MSKLKTNNEAFLSTGFMLMVSTLVVNIGNYAFNLLTGRILSPEAFGEANFLVTCLLAVSFVATAFQLTAAKFSDPQNQLSDLAWILGFMICAGVLVFSNNIADAFQLTSETSLSLLAMAVPFYFVMSVGRGKLQGDLHFGRFAITYQVEMWARLIVGIGMVALFRSAWGVVIGLLVSIGSGFIYTNLAQKTSKTAAIHIKSFEGFSTFFGATLLYELSQIVINNSDVLIVKHYFTTQEAGLYAALALIGRVVYFGTWSVVMVLFPKVIEQKKKGLPTHQLLVKSFAIVALIAAIIVAGCLAFSEWIVGTLFGKNYLSISTYLWQYASVTALFACANVWVYYHLSLDRKTPILLSLLAGILQFFLLYVKHGNFGDVIQGQCISMLFLFFSLLVYHFVVTTRYFSFNPKNIQLS